VKASLNYVCRTVVLILELLELDMEREPMNTKVLNCWYHFPHPGMVCQSPQTQEIT
jgi:hypothetical protein